MLFDQDKWVREAREIFELRYLRFLKVNRGRTEAPAAGGVGERAWLQYSREALQLSVQMAASRGKMNPSTWRRFEERELQGDVTLANLSRLAESLDCEFIYLIRPKNRKSFADLLWERILPKALEHASIRSKTFPLIPERRRALRLATVAGDLFEKPAFRREAHWSQRRPKGLDYFSM